MDGETATWLLSEYGGKWSLMIDAENGLLQQNGFGFVNNNDLLKLIRKFESWSSTSVYSGTSPNRHLYNTDTSL